MKELEEIKIQEQEREDEERRLQEQRRRQIEPAEIQTIENVKK